MLEGLARFQKYMVRYGRYMCFPWYVRLVRLGGTVGTVGWYGWYGWVVRLVRLVRLVGMVGTVGTVGWYGWYMLARLVHVGAVGAVVAVCVRLARLVRDCRCGWYGAFGTLGMFGTVRLMRHVCHAWYTSLALCSWWASCALIGEVVKSLISAVGTQWVFSRCSVVCLVHLVLFVCYMSYALWARWWHAWSSADYTCFFWCNTVGTYAFMKAAPFMMHLHAIVQMHVLLILLIAASCCIACFELKECVGVESIGMSLELETVRSVLTQTTETVLLADLDSKQLSAC